MNYSIVGTGNVGQALAKAFARKGIEVAFASRRSPGELAPLARAISPTAAPTFLQEALEADTILLAVPFGSYRDVAQAAANWQGKAVIDVTNAYGVDPASLGNRPSSEVIAEALPGAGLVKAFNHLPAAVLAEDTEVGGGRRVLFLAGNDEDAVARVSTLVDRLGFASVALGRLDEGGLLVQARGNVWAPPIFQDLFKREEAR